jgi:hypothetical protein
MRLCRMVAIRGRVEESSQAQATYHGAVAKGLQSALLQQRRGDVFELLVGNLLPGQRCTVNIS